MKTTYLIGISILISSFLSPYRNDSNAIFREADSPVVRESTTDIQVRVGEKLYVFGKAQGTLDNVKIGKNLVNFSQNPTIAGIKSDFHQVSWKKLKNGAIQIQSSYQPWPNILTWQVLPDGKLKLETSGSDPSFNNSSNFGLGFDFPEHELKNMEVNNQKYSIQSPISSPKTSKNVRIEFVHTNLTIHSESIDMAFMTNFSKEKSQDADLVISFPELREEQDTPSAPGVTFTPTGKNLLEGKGKMVLWFDFQ